MAESMARWRNVFRSLLQSTPLRFRTGQARNPDAADLPSPGPLSCDDAARRDPKAAALLALLWQSEASSLGAKRSKFDAPRPALENGATWPFTPSAQSRQEAHSLQELAAFIESHTPDPPRSQEEMNAALTVGLSASLYHNLRELEQTDEIFPLLHLADAVRIIQALQFTPLHEPLCELLVGARHVIRADRDGPRIAPLQSLRHKVRIMLAAWPPDSAPALWRMLQAPSTSAEFWPVVEKMRQPSAVPFLLDALPALSWDGKASVIVALQNIGDTRAIPHLQALAQDQAGAVAPQAASAVAHILRHSRSEAAQLLRSSSAREVGTGETLLRAAHSAPDAAPHELLRGAETSAPPVSDKGKRK